MAPFFPITNVSSLYCHLFSQSLFANKGHIIRINTFPDLEPPSEFFLKILVTPPSQAHVYLAVGDCHWRRATGPTPSTRPWRGTSTWWRTSSTRRAATRRSGSSRSPRAATPKSPPQPKPHPPLMPHQPAIKPGCMACRVWAFTLKEVWYTTHICLRRNC